MTATHTHATAASNRLIAHRPGAVTYGHEHSRLNRMTNGSEAGNREGSATVVQQDSADDEHPFDVRRRDVRDPEAIREMKIISAKGTVRGIKNRVRAGIATFLENESNGGVKKKNYQQQEKGRIVIYSTTMMIVRGTCEKCKKVRRMLQTHMVQFEDRDIFMSRENQLELMERLNSERMDVPQVFADGQYLGDADEIEKLNESGELRKIFSRYKRITKATSCEECGGYRYTPCTTCHGSKKSLHRNHFTEEFCALRCIVCDENGLVKCGSCAEQPPKT